MMFCGISKIALQGYFAVYCGDIASCLKQNQNARKITGKNAERITYEFPRTVYTWLIRLLYRTGYIVGWTLLVAMFVTRFPFNGCGFIFHSGCPDNCRYGSVFTVA